MTACVVMAFGITGAWAVLQPSVPPPGWALEGLTTEVLVPGSAQAVAAAGDERYAWLLVDRLRFDQRRTTAQELEQALARLTGTGVESGEVAWVAHSDALLRREVEAPPGYLDLKSEILLTLGDPRWEPFLREPADVDWRHVTWGGVGRDGIVALSDPVVVDAVDATWLVPTDTVFGVVSGDEARAYPRRILVVHELVNDSLGGRRIAVPYCTLCGSAIPYVTDGVGELRTSGLLQRSNKLMYDVATESLFDQFLGVGVSGPQRGVALERLNVVVTTWQQWREAHPQTTTLARPPAGDRNLADDPYSGDFLGGRDTAGPIFPVGDRDSALADTVEVLGVQAPTGVAVAFPVDAVDQALMAGRTVQAGGVSLSREGGGLVARPIEGGPILPSHHAFWFAWSQFRADTLLWQG